MNYYEHHLGDYAKDAGHLSMVEEGAYRRLLDAYYIREAPLPPELRECWKLARATTKIERDAVAYVLRTFFELCEDGYHQGRADAEIARFLESQPDREERKANDRERQRRARERRKVLFDKLREHDIVPGFNTKTADLEAMLSRVTPGGQSRDPSRNASRTVTRDNTATQAPDTIHQTPIPRDTHTPSVWDVTVPETPEQTAERLLGTAPSPASTPGNDDPPPTQARRTPSPAAEVCIALRAAGIASVNPAHPKLLALLEAGATVPEFVGAIDKARDKRDAFAYLLGVVEGQRRDAASMAPGLRQGAMPASTAAAPTMSFAERSTAAKAARLHDMTSGLLGAPLATQPGAAAGGDVIDMEASDGTPRRLA